MFDKRVLLVTTGDSCVRQQLEHICGRYLHIADCNIMVRKDLLFFLRSISYDILITYRCPYILPSDIICNAVISAFNIHPSLLPAYSGLNPWEEMIKNNEKMGGVTFHVLTDKVDQGRILLNRSLELDFSLGLAYNRNKVDELAGTMISKVLGTILTSSSPGS